MQPYKQPFDRLQRLSAGQSRWATVVTWNSLRSAGCGAIGDDAHAG